MSRGLPADISTVAALLTPVGRGAIATIGVRGPDAARCADHAFRSTSDKRIADSRIGRVLFGVFTSISGAQEELIVCRTSEEEVEIHCHGGQAAVESILQTLRSLGVQTVSSMEWLTQQELGLLTAEAITAFGAATTERTAGILLDQYRGALRQEVAAIRENLNAVSNASESRDRLSRLSSRIPLGRHLTQPFRIVLAGQPNVGKSSLINALCGYRRAIVSPQPGTTRDVVTAATAFAGWPVALADTAGVRESSDALEAAGIARTRQQLSEADLVLVVCDHSSGWSAAEEHLVYSSPMALAVYNKFDLAGSQGTQNPPGVFVSALTGQGLSELEQAIIDKLGLNSIQPTEAVPFTERQAQWLECALDLKTQLLSPHDCLTQLLTNPFPPDK